MSPDSTDRPQFAAIERVQAFGPSLYAARTFVALTGLEDGTAQDVSDVAEVPGTRVYDAVEERIRGEASGVETFDSLWIWSDTPAGRLLMVDEDKTLVSVIASEGGGGPAGRLEGTAILGTGATNSLVVVLKTMFTCNSTAPGTGTGNSNSNAHNRAMCGYTVPSGTNTPAMGSTGRVTNAGTQVGGWPTEVRPCLTRKLRRTRTHRTPGSPSARTPT